MSGCFCCMGGAVGGPLRDFLEGGVYRCPRKGFMMVGLSISLVLNRSRMFYCEYRGLPVSLHNVGTGVTHA